MRFDGNGQIRVERVEDPDQAVVECHRVPMPVPQKAASGG